ncbi:4Fe-4S single cluster domain-containing protein [Nocardia sp. NPDC003482]
MLNVAAVSVTAESLGPGRRAVVWVQGCPFSCQGCVAPEWIPFQEARLVAPAELAGEVLSGPPIDGVTLSGGEPMLQAAGLTEFVRLIRSRVDTTVICFTGFTLRRLRSHPPEGVAELLSEIDVLIDGRYMAERNNGRGLRGSTNQVVHHLTDRLRGVGYDFENRSRTAELRINERSVTLIGVPPAGLLAALDEALDRHAGPRAAEEGP